MDTLTIVLIFAIICSVFGNVAQFLILRRYWGMEKGLATLSKFFREFDNG